MNHTTPAQDQDNLQILGCYFGAIKYVRNYLDNYKGSEWEQYCWFQKFTDEMLKVFDAKKLKVDESCLDTPEMANRRCPKCKTLNESADFIRIRATGYQHVCCGKWDDDPDAD